MLVVLHSMLNTPSMHQNRLYPLKDSLQDRCAPRRSFGDRALLAVNKGNFTLPTVTSALGSSKNANERSNQDNDIDNNKHITLALPQTAKVSHFIPRSRRNLATLLQELMPAPYFQMTASIHTSTVPTDKSTCVCVCVKHHHSMHYNVWPCTIKYTTMWQTYLSSLGCMTFQLAC